MSANGRYLSGLSDGPMPYELDDTQTDPAKLWSSDKINTELEYKITDGADDAAVTNLGVSGVLTVGPSPSDYNLPVLKGAEGDILKQGPTKNVVMGFRTVSKTSAPTVNDDFFAGYERNSKWCNQNTGKCLRVLMQVQPQQSGSALITLVNLL